MPWWSSQQLGQSTNKVCVRHRGKTVPCASKSPTRPATSESQTALVLLPAGVVYSTKIAARSLPVLRAHSCKLAVQGFQFVWSVRVLNSSSLISYLISITMCAL